jgi:putative ABC transport system substrate-binding protein
MRRLEFIALFGGAMLLRPVGAIAQQIGKAPRIGVLHPGYSQDDLPYRSAFHQRLHELGYTEGQNIVIEHLYAEWSPDRLPIIAAEAVGRKVDIIVVVSTSPALAAKEATDTIPIVVSAMADPVGDGLVASLARPGGNITGNTFIGPELIAKRLGLLKEIVPGLSRVAGLWHPRAYSEGTMARMVKDTEAAAESLALQLQLVPARDPDALNDAFSEIAAHGAGAFIVLPSPMLFSQHSQIVELARTNGLPGMYQAREFVDAGGLMSYGANIAELNRRSAVYVDKILKGAKPADLPVEQPTKFEFLLNLKTARQLGLIVPTFLLASADEVIE